MAVTLLVLSVFKQVTLPGQVSVPSAKASPPPPALPELDVQEAGGGSVLAGAPGSEGSYSCREGTGLPVVHGGSGRRTCPPARSDHPLHGRTWFRNREESPEDDPWGEPPRVAGPHCPSCSVRTEGPGDTGSGFGLLRVLHGLVIFHKHFCWHLGETGFGAQHPSLCELPRAAPPPPRGHSGPATAGVGLDRPVQVWPPALSLAVALGTATFPDPSFHTSNMGF